MVYNNMVYRPASLGERLQAKFGERAAAAVFRASSNEQITSADKKTQTGEVLSFFGRVDDTKTADRAIPSKKRTAPQRQEVRVAGMQTPARNVRTAPVNTSVRKNIQSGNVNQRAAGTNTRRVAANVADPHITASFTRAYAAGERVRRTAVDYSARPQKRYAAGAVPSGALRRGRSNIPGARHAVLVTHDTHKDKRSAFQVMKEAFSDRHIAEHRVKKEPFPLGYLTLIGICTAMVMLLLFSFSQINEYTDNINTLKQTQSELDEEAAKLEVLLEERDDIRNIEQIAVDEIGMVSSDMVQSKFVSVSASDRVEVMTNDAEEEDKGAFSTLLSIIGESFGHIGEYFN